MDIQSEKLKIIQKLLEVDKEWMLLSVKRLLDIDNSKEDELIENYRAMLTPMTKKELISRALEAEDDLKAGRYVELETYMFSIPL